MIKNLFVVAIRNLKRYPGYSLLNIFGLMIGITFSLFLIFYIRDELNYDKYHQKAARIFRVNSYIKEPDKEMLLEKLTTQINSAIEHLKTIDPSTLTENRTVGRKKLPSTVMGLIFHAAEHTMRHTGQLLVTVKVLTESGA